MFIGGGIDYGSTKLSELHIADFNIGQTVAVVNISINDDNIIETDETFHLTIANTTVDSRLVVFGTLVSATVTIRDNDGEFLIYASSL